MSTLGYIVVGGLALAIIVSVIRLWGSGLDDWDDHGGPYL